MNEYLLKTYRHTKSINYKVTVVLIISFIFAYILNMMTFYASDDYVYAFIYRGAMPVEPLQKINGLMDIATSQFNHYYMWNGRFVAHTIVQFFMQYEKAVFNIFNSIAFSFLGLMIYWIISTSTPINNRPLFLLCVYFSLWLIIPEFGSSVLWLSGSGNYLWTSLIYTGFILFNIKIKKSTPLIFVLSCIFGFLSGATNENSGPAATVIVFLIMANEYISDKKINICKAFGILFSIIGFLLMMLSPGSRRRGEVDFDINTLISHITSVIKVDVHLFFIPYLLLLSLLFFAIYKKIKIERKDIIFILIFITGHFSGIYCLILSPEVPLRAAFGPSIFLIIVICYSLCRINILNKAFFISFPVVVGTYIYAFIDINKTYSELKIQISEIKKSDKNTDVKLLFLSPPKSMQNAYKETTNLTSDTSSWFNSWMAAYYNVKSVKGEDK
ncbi:DUF6056 family protein [Morganella morganii]|uniref:DUF3329 domain-containing protein n=1 Tax=Morganella morganii TaxID=582 RepID=UPI0034E54374